MESNLGPHGESAAVARCKSYRIAVPKCLDILMKIKERQAELDTKVEELGARMNTIKHSGQNRRCGLTAKEGAHSLNAFNTE